MPSVIYSCHPSPKNAQHEKEKENKISAKKKIIPKPPSSFNDTMVIKNNSAVFYSPDSLQLEKIKAVNKKPIYDMLEHDCYYQMRNARSVIKQYWPKIKIIEATEARYLLFIKADNSKICIDLNNKNDICGLLLFDGKKDPILTDMPNIDTQLQYYFK
ncbi:MAG TPA: hypothetical protein VMT76_16725 [Puia sp.]|nr:hypothetical protein [Puia sp.]